ncbi:hypothetical protein O3P69_018263 [Scylla paramamosain]|uniref:Uncharacterized protein n=1 Tax=Scylla paramamosain TaxID=85552 RepID=A0AAW0TJR4_SCYPA
MYPPNPLPYVIPPPPPAPPVCLPPHAAMKGHDLYFSGQHGAPRGPGMGSVRGPWSYYGQPLVEGTLDHGSYMMPPMPALFQGTPYSYYPSHYVLPVPQHHMHQRQTVPRKTDEKDKISASDESQTTEKMKEYLKLKEDRTRQVQVKGVITEVHCRMGKLRLQSGKEYYFSPDLCFLYGVSLADLELWHVLIEGQQVKVTLNDINSELPKVTRVTVEEEDPDSDPDATTLNIQQWCSGNCVPEEATMKLVQQVKGLQ